MGTGHDHAGRIARIRASARAATGRDDLLFVVTDLEQVRYATGFTGTNALLAIGPDTSWFVTDPRYGVQSRLEVACADILVAPQGTSLLERLFGTDGTASRGGAIGYAPESMTVADFDLLVELLPQGTTTLGVSGIVAAVKAIKEPVEIEAIRVACRLADAGCAFLVERIRTGVSEREVAWELECFLRTHGARRLAFDTIVASGPNAAIVHARAGERVLGASGRPEFVLVDFGCEVDGYCSDITRMFVVGGAPDARMREMHAAVDDARRAALERVAPGARGRDVDAAARAILADRGLPPMPHNTGHGLGRLVHDAAGVFTPASTLVLAEGMVATVEPGAYVEGWGGVRIEDDVVVMPGGCDRLTRFPHDLVVLG